MGSRTLYGLVIAAWLGLGDVAKLLAAEDPCTTVSADRALGLLANPPGNLCITSGGVGYGDDLVCDRRFIVELVPADHHHKYYLVGAEDQLYWPAGNQDLCSKIVIDVTFYTAQPFKGWAKSHSYRTRGKWESGKCQRMDEGQPRFYPNPEWHKKIRVAVRASYSGWKSKTIPARVNVIYFERDLKCLCPSTNDKALNLSSSWPTCSLK